MKKQKSAAKPRFTGLFMKNKVALALIVGVFAGVGGSMIFNSSANPNLPGDINNDNVVNINDLSILLSNWGKTFNPNPGPNPNPPVPPNPPGPTPQPFKGAKRDIVALPAGGLGQYNLSSKAYIAGFRFELDQALTIDRWYFMINGEGSSCVGGRPAYGNGNGGTHWGRIVEVDQTTGFPILNKILAQETVAACTAHNRSKSEYGLSTTHQHHWVQFAPVSLQPGRMYAFLLSNTDPNPGTGGAGDSGNHMSINTNFTSDEIGNGSVAWLGPNAANTLDPDAPGAVGGWGPREATIWSADTGATWRFGQRVGWYQTGDDPGRGKTWPVGYRIAGGKSYAHGWPGAGYTGHVSNGSITWRNSPRAVTITRAGGTSADGSVGVVTVKNNRTGVSGKTGSLGDGMPKGTLDNPVPIAVGDSFTVSNSGRVDTATSEGQFKAYGIPGQPPWDITTSAGSDRIVQLWAAPFPFFPGSGD